MKFREIITKHAYELRNQLQDFQDEHHIKSFSTYFDSRNNEHIAIIWYDE